MDDIRSSDLKTILHSKRANIYYLEYCRVLVNGGRVEYVTDEGKRSLYWNIPIANTTTILLGTGTSLTQAAVRELAKAGVQIGFCGGGGTPLFAGYERERAPDETILPNRQEGPEVAEKGTRDQTCNDSTCDLDGAGQIEACFLSPQSEYRPMEYCQAWMRFWFEESYRLMAAKAFQERRIDRILPQWKGLNRRETIFAFDEAALAGYLETARQDIAAAPDVSALLQAEARLTKRLYALAAQAVEMLAFTRAKRGAGADLANNFLDHGNYLAYGLAATASWVLGIPHSFPVLHGKTRRGGLVFDIADLIKDSTILPLAFLCASDGKTEQEFRAACIDRLTRSEALDFMIETLKEVAMTTGRMAANGVFATKANGGAGQEGRLDYVTVGKGDSGKGDGREGGI